MTATAELLTAVTCEVLHPREPGGWSQHSRLLSLPCGVAARSSRALTCSPLWCHGSAMQKWPACPGLATRDDDHAHAWVLAVHV